MGKRIERNAIVPMRDGKLLRTDLDSPEDADSPVAVLAAWSRLGKHGGSALALGRALSSGLVHPDPGGTQGRENRRGSPRGLSQALRGPRRRQHQHPNHKTVQTAKKET